MRDDRILEKLKAAATELDWDTTCTFSIGWTHRLLTTKAGIRRKILISPFVCTTLLKLVVLCFAVRKVMWGQHLNETSSNAVVMCRHVLVDGKTDGVDAMLTKKGKLGKELGTKSYSADISIACRRKRDDILDDVNSNTVSDDNAKLLQEDGICAIWTSRYTGTELRNALLD